MSSQIPFLDAETFAKAPAAQPIQAITSSAALGWEGIYLERGFSDEFIAEDVYLPGLYLAMHTGTLLTFERKAGRGFKQQSMESGQIWFHPPNLPFTHYVTHRCDYIALIVDVAKLGSLLPRPSSFHHLHFEQQYDVDDAQLRGILQTLTAEMEAGAPNGQLFFDAMTTALGLHLVRHYNRSAMTLPDAAKGLDRQTLQLVIDYMEAHLAENLSVHDLAQVAGVSKFHFNRLFKQSTQHTPYQFFLQRRLERAKHLLDYDDLTISQISYQLGFNDQSHFSKRFKEAYGLTPRCYRKQRTY